MSKNELAIVMPVYNEEECIADAVFAWVEALTDLDINFQFYILNDGSTDGTQQALEQFRTDGRFCLIQKSNTGHGPSILMGYALAVENADWVFQTDSDLEIAPCHFAGLWRSRNGYDAVMGVRVGRRQPIARRRKSRCRR